MDPLHRSSGRAAPARRRAGRRGLTLVELVVAMSLAAGVAVAVGHVVTQMTRGAASLDRRSQVQSEATIALFRMRSELEFATVLDSLSASRITFLRPDPGGGTTCDLVTYEWAGLSGSPLTRQVNSDPAEPLLERCRSFSVSAVTPPIRLEAGTFYPLRVEYYEQENKASARLDWTGPSISKQIIPADRLFPAYTPVGTTPPTTSTGTGLLGEYYDNADFSRLKMTRVDSTVDFDWNLGSPGFLGIDTFSIRWTGQLRPAVTGDYTLCASANDGIRVWLNHRLVIDNWTRQTGTSDTGATTGTMVVELHVEAGDADNPAKLDAAVHLLNAACHGGPGG